MAAFRCFDPIQMQLPWRELGGVQPGMGAGCEGGRCGFLLPASRISTKDTKGHEGKRRRRPQGDDRKSGPCTAAGADWEQGRSSLQPVCCAPSFVQFTVSDPIRKRSWQHFGALTQFRCDCPGENWVGCSPEWGRGVKGGDAAIRTGNRRSFGRSTVQIYDAGSGSASTRVCVSSREFHESLREFTRVLRDESLREFTRARVCESLREFTRVCVSLRESTQKIFESEYQFVDD